MVISRSFQLPARVYQDTLFPCIPGSVGWVQTSSSMSASQALQHLYSLDKSSSEFLRAVYKFTRLDENGECSFNLQQSESARLVDVSDEAWPNRCATSFHLYIARCTSPTVTLMFSLNHRYSILIPRIYRCIRIYARTIYKTIKSE